VTYVLYGVALAFAWFVCVNAVASAVVAIWARQISSCTRLAAPATRARFLLALRMLPATAAIAFIAAIFVPSFVLYEPRNFDEAFGVTVSSLAVLAWIAILAAAWRGGTAVVEAHRRVNACLRDGSPVSIGMPRAFRVDAPSASMTLVGLFRPRLLVTGRLLDLLEPDELAAAVAHESSHLRSRDNLKRLVMRSAPDFLLWSRTARSIEQDWVLASEHAADEQAARDNGAALALASALLKVARSASSGFAPAISSPLVGGEALRARVERLLSWSSLPAVATRSGRAAAARALGASILLLGLGLTAAWAYRPALSTVHGITEAVVHRVP
jgi:Zn-dependent protease with chaperone function